MLIFKAKKPRAFNYKYRFYKPDDDENRPRIDFHCDSNRRYDRKGSIVKMIILLLFIAYFIFSLQKALKSPGNVNADSDTIIVEEVIVVD